MEDSKTNSNPPEEDRDQAKLNVLSYLKYEASILNKSSEERIQMLENILEENRKLLVCISN
jgi:hypothetical protein